MQIFITPKFTAEGVLDAYLLVEGISEKKFEEYYIFWIILMVIMVFCDSIGIKKDVKNTQDLKVEVLVI